MQKTGTYNQNMKVLERGFGELIVKRCPPQEVPYTSYLPCEHCLDFYFKKDLHRHIKKCKKSIGTARKGSRVKGKGFMLLPTQANVSPALAKNIRKNESG